MSVLPSAQNAIRVSLSVNDSYYQLPTTNTNDI